MTALSDAATSRGVQSGVVPPQSKHLAARTCQANGFLEARAVTWRGKDISISTIQSSTLIYGLAGEAGGW